MNNDNDSFNKVVAEHAEYISLIANTYQKNKIKFFGKCCLSKDEIEQNIRIAIWKCLPRYKPDGGMSLRSFIWQSAHWELNREYKQLNKLQGYKKDKSVNILDGIETKDCVNSLPEKYKDVLIKYYLEGKTLQEIGTELGKTAESVRICKIKAKKILEERLLK